MRLPVAAALGAAILAAFPTTGRGQVASGAGGALPATTTPARRAEPPIDLAPAHLPQPPAPTEARTLPRSGMGPKGVQHDVMQPPPPSPAYAAELVARARALQLAKKKQWIRLGHWRRPLSPTRFVWYTSEADGADFFLAAKGKGSPAAELEATLVAFATSEAEGDDHPICRFPARFAWLDRVLHFDYSRMRVPSCPGFEKFVASMRPKKLVVVFSSYYMGRAASAFGHTFLRVERAGEPGVIGKRRQLLDTGIDYAATTTTSNAVAYALMGIFGGFRGAFHKLPYYFKVREYNDFESRDLWEYELDLSGEELTMAIAHLWELGHTYFDYFYMTENCAYHILDVVDVVKPELGLIDSLRVPVVPADTIKALTRVPGLVSRITFRPSLNTQFHARLERLDSGQKDMVAALVRDPAAPMPPAMTEAQRVAVLDAAADLVDLRWPDQVLNDPSSRGARTKLALLKRRARIPAASQPLVIEPPWRDQPHMAHGSGRIGLGGGWRQGVGSFTELSGRVNLHDLLDNPNGYPEQAAIEFLPMRARVYLDEPALELEDISLVRITQLNSYSRFNKKVAWSIDVGGSRIRDAGCTDCFAGHFKLGGGLARALGHGAVTLYSLLDFELHFAPALDGIAGSGFRGEVGPRAGIRLRFRNDLIGLVEGATRWLPEQEPGLEWGARGGFRWQLLPGYALDLAASASNQTDLDAGAALMHYF